MKGNYVMLRAGDLRLVLPQHEVGSALYLEWDSRQDKGRFIAVEIAGADGVATWCWDELRVLIDVDLERIDLPAALRGKTSPIGGFVELDSGPAFVCMADDVATVMAEA
jgi:hypothetical protein